MCGVRRYIQQASGFFLKTDSGLADESGRLAIDASAGVAASAQMYADLESRLLNSSGEMEGLLLRYGFFYGPYFPKTNGGHITRVGESYWKSVAPDARVLGCSKGRPDHGISDSDKNINLRKTMAYQPLYTAVATATGGRDGHVESSDGIVKLDLSVPREMGGPGKPGTSNPEQLFASGYSACFAGAIGFVANQQHKKLSDIQVTGHVTFGKVDENSTYNAGGTTYPLPGFQLAVQLDVHLPGVDKAEAEKLVEQAHQVCPYSRATRNNIEVKLAVV